MSAPTTPITSAMPNNLLRIADLTREQLTELLDLAAAMRSEPGGWLETYRGELLACYFAKPSTRTRVSFEGAAYRLGMLPVMLRPEELQLGRGEPISDTARVLSGYAAAIVVRTFAQAEVQELADAARVPVINALTEEHHPCQALADLLTLRDCHGSLQGLKVAYVGDGNNVARSLMQAGALAGMHVAVASPVGYLPPTALTAQAHETALRHEGSIRVGHAVEEAVAGAHAVYTDAWVSMGQDEQHDRRLADLGAFQVNEQVMSHAEPDAVFMHCLPAHRGLEVTADVIDGPRSVVFQQAENRLCTEQAVIHALVNQHTREGKAC
jgi:ornithine carbamoyltransferase